MTREKLIAKTVDQRGRRVVLLPDDWLYISSKIDRRLTVMDLILTVSAPDLVSADPKPGRLRYYKRGLGPSTWVRVVVRYEEDDGAIYNALPNRRLPSEDRT